MSSAVPTPTPIPSPSPPIANYIIGFLLIGLAWGFTTPFIRAAARAHTPAAHPILETAAVKSSTVKKTIYGAWFAVTDLLRNWRYAVPLVVNLTGSVWFFLLIGKAGEWGFFCSLGGCAGWGLWDGWGEKRRK
jgi:hypothetical protein